MQFHINWYKIRAWRDHNKNAAVKVSMLKTGFIYKRSQKLETVTHESICLVLIKGKNNDSLLLAYINC